MQVVTDIVSLEDINALPRPIYGALFDSAVNEADAKSDIFLDAVAIMQPVLETITALDPVVWSNAPFSILNPRTLWGCPCFITIDKAGQVLAEW